jgi:hypothetical protein
MLFADIVHTMFSGMCILFMKLVDRYLFLSLNYLLTFLNCIYIALNGRKIMNNELGRTWEEVVMACLKPLSQYLLGGT